MSTGWAAPALKSMAFRTARSVYFQPSWRVLGQSWRSRAASACARRASHPAGLGWARIAGSNRWHGGRSSTAAITPSPPGPARP